MKDDQSRVLSGKGNFHTIDFRYQDISASDTGTQKRNLSSDLCLLIRFKTADRTICIAIIYRKGNRPISLAIRKGEFSQEILTVRVWQA